MDELEELVDRGDGVNFVPCLKWVRRGVAKSQPERVKLTKEELAKIIKQTQSNIDDLEEEEAPKNQDDTDQVQNEAAEVEEEAGDDDKEFEKRYGLDTYDDEDPDASAALGLGNIVSFANPRDDPYLDNPDLEDDQSDVEDFAIKGTDNLILVGHVEGNASILEVYVYNSVEEALYVHHDILLPSFPLALEWLNFDPGEESRSNLVAIGTMDPVIDVWDIDVVDSLEPAFSLGQKGSKKKKVARVGHKDAVLSLAWNHRANHLLASGSVDQTVMLWDLREGKVARTIKDHKEKVQALSWHPFETEMLLTGCCDEKARIFDCNNEVCKAWKVDGEVEKVLWNHFNPFTFLVATEKGMVHMIDARVEGKHLWTLNAHSEGINGMSLSSQCPDCLVTGSSDQTVKVWDIKDNKPSCVLEKDIRIGLIHSLEACPDAPFVFSMGGDTPSNNLHVWDIREAAVVQQRFGNRQLANPMGFSGYGYPTANAADQETAIGEDAMATDEAATTALQSMTISKDTGGAVGKFKKKDKKKKKKNNF